MQALIANEKHKLRSVEPEKRQDVKYIECNMIKAIETFSCEPTPKSYQIPVDSNNKYINTCPVYLS